MSYGQPFSRAFIAAILLVTAMVSVPSQAMKLKQQNVQQLVAASESIIFGRVIRVTDGFQNGAPYTEVTLRVGSDARGKLKEDSEYTFRQFGLTKPRSMGNGKVYLGVSPEGFAKWREGEQVIAFLYRKAGITGFQTTAGMAQGKFVVSNDKAVNEFNNLGLFEGMDTTGLSSEEVNMTTTPGAVSSAVFMGLVGKLAEEQ